MSSFHKLLVFLTLFCLFCFIFLSLIAENCNFFSQKFKSKVPMKNILKFKDCTRKISEPKVSKLIKDNEEDF